MNPRVLSAIAVLTMASPPPALAAAQLTERCGPPLQTASSHLRIDNGNVEYDFTKTREDLFRLYRENRKESAASHRTGLTMARLHYEVEADVRVRPAAGGFCVELRSVKATLGFPLLKVYIDQRYVVGGCNHQAVMKHENEHVAINRRVLAKHGKDLRARLKTMVERAPVLFVASKDQAREAHLKFLNSEIEPIFDSIQRDLRSSHAVIDTEASYRSLTGLCENW
jgi:hypothetical protein